MSYVFKIVVLYPWFSYPCSYLDIIDSRAYKVKDYDHFFFQSFEQHASKRAPQNGCHRLSPISRDFNLLLLNFCLCTRPTFGIHARDGDWDNGNDLDCPFRLCQGVYASHFNGRQTYANNQIGLALTSFAWADIEVIHLSCMKIFNYCCLILGKDL